MREIVKLASAYRFRETWPRIAPHLGCDGEIHSVETDCGGLATLLDADTGVDYIAVRLTGGHKTKIPIAARTHETDDRAHAGWTVRYKRPASAGECEYFRLIEAVKESASLYPRLMVELYFASDGGIRAYIARTIDVVGWCRHQLAKNRESALYHRQLRINPEDGVQFFAPSFGNLNGDGKPVSFIEFPVSSESQLALFASEPAPIINEAHGAPWALWR